MGDEAANHLRLIESDEAQAWIAIDEPTLIVVGAGLSMGDPTNAPGVAPFMNRTLDRLVQAAGLPVEDGTVPLGPDGLDIRELAQRLLPESCYGVIGQVFDTNRHLEMWAALGPQAAIRVGASPSPAHRQLVALAATRRWPIITTNFDCFLEIAANQEGYGYRAIVPYVSERVLLEPQLGEVSLMKLHGTTLHDSGTDSRQQVERIRSTAADLSRCARIMERLRVNPEPARLLVIGYSGRDLDLFPWLCARFGGPSGMVNERVLWVDPDFRNPAASAPRHRALILSSCTVGLAAYANEIADTSYVATANRVDSGVRRATFRAEAESAVDNALDDVVTPHTPEAVAALVGVLSSVGMHAELVELESSLIGPGRYTYGRMCGLLWLAGAYSALDRYDDAARVLKHVRHQALASRSVNAYLRAWIASAYARTAGHSLRIVDSTKKLATWKLAGPYLSVFAVTAAAGPLAGAYFFRTRDDDNPSSDHYSLVCDYLEHWIRLGALLDKSRRRFRLADKPLRALWAVIEKACRSAGYTTGVLNAGRYRGRVEGGLAWFDSAVTRAELVGHPIGLSIAHRDTAVAELDSGRSLESVAERMSMALHYAEQARSPSLILKVRREQLKAGVAHAMSPREIDVLLDRTNGCRALEAQRADIVLELSQVPGRGNGHRML